MISDAHGQSSFSLDILELVRFASLNIVLTPPNYLWQLYLERTFPASRKQAVHSLPLTRKDSRALKEDEDEIGAPRRSRLNIKNTLLKWFIDCMTVGAVVNTVAFLIVMGCFKGQSINQISHNVRTVSAHPCSCEWRIPYSALPP